MEYSKWISFKLDNWLNNFRTCDIYCEFSSQSAYQCKVFIIYLLSYIISVVGETVHTVCHFWRFRWIYVIISQSIRLKETFYYT